MFAENYRRIDLPPLPYDADNAGAPPLERKHGVETARGVPNPNDIPSSVAMTATNTITPARVESQRTSSCSVAAQDACPQSSR
jgi:hypothetical protein